MKPNMNELYIVALSAFVMSKAMTGKTLNACFYSNRICNQVNVQLINFTYSFYHVFKQNVSGSPILFLLYINFHKCSSLLDFHLFADDANLFYLKTTH